MSKRRLLLADDSVTIQKVVNLTFADEGIEVTTVGDGDTAMKRFVEATPDLVMVDVNMPGLDGYRICEMIKQDAETAHIPVILLVGSFEPFDEAEARRVGADDFMTKPFQSIRQLVNKVSELLNGKNVADEYLPPVANVSAVENDFNAAGKIDEPEVAAESVSVIESNFEHAELNSQHKKVDDFEEITPKNYGEAVIDDEMIQTSQFAESRSGTPMGEKVIEYESEPVSETESFYDSFNDDAETDKPEPLGYAATFSDAVAVNTDSVKKQSFYEENFAESAMPEVSNNIAVPPPETTKTGSVFNFDDFDLLEFPQLSKKAIADQVVLQNGSELLQRKSFENDEANAATSPTETAENSNDNQPLSGVSPELIEAIADKVVEKISSKFIAKVVREVLSQMEKN